MSSTEFPFESCYATETRFYSFLINIWFH